MEKEGKKGKRRICVTIANCLLPEPDAKDLIFPPAAAQLAHKYSLALCACQARHLQVGKAELGIVSIEFVPHVDGI